jgi:hypothetical protein
MRAIPDPTTYEQLADFSCGGSSDHEQHVDSAVEELLQLSSEDLADYKIRKVRVAEDSETDSLIGISVIQEKRLSESDDTFEHAAYLAVLAIDKSYRGWRMPDGATRIGTFLLGDALAEIDCTWEQPMPYVWAVVHPENDHCRRLLNKQNFWPLHDINKDPSEYIVYLRDESVDWSHGFGPHVIRSVLDARGE